MPEALGWSVQVRGEQVRLVIEAADMDEDGVTAEVVKLDMSRGDAREIAESLVRAAEL